MRIAQIAPLNVSIPPKTYGGTERVIDTLTEELVRRGHDVTLFASGDSRTSANLVALTPQALTSRDEYEHKNKVFDIYEHTALNILHCKSAYAMQNEFDIIHDHTAQNYPVSLIMAEQASVPTVVTLHGAFTKSTKALYAAFHKPYYVSISKAQAALAPHLHYAGNVYHGLTMEHYPFSEHDEGYLLYVGRLSVEKGVHHAIHVAKALDIPLIIAGAPDLNYKKYMETAILPHISDKIMWIGEVDEERRNELMSKALCLLHPVTWAEPFGLTMIEAMACGCPVVGFDKGSVPEVIKHGTSGYVVESVAEMIQAVQKIKRIKRTACRAYALKTFTVRKMVDSYERIYEQILSRREKDVVIPSLRKQVFADELQFEFSPDFS